MRWLTEQKLEQRIAFEELLEGTRQESERVAGRDGPDPSAHLLRAPRHGRFCGFKLMPTGFFDRNPMIDMAPTRNEASCCV